VKKSGSEATAGQGKACGHGDVSLVRRDGRDEGHPPRDCWMFTSGEIERIRGQMQQLCVRCAGDPWRRSQMDAARFKRAFEALTRGRQREYLFHFAGAQQSGTVMSFDDGG
jgi:hypothetical protein